MKKQHYMLKKAVAEMSGDSADRYGQALAKALDVMRGQVSGNV